MDDAESMPGVVQESATLVAPNGQRSPWWVLHTRARHEKRLAEALGTSGIRHYLPLVSVHHTYTMRSVTFQVPLFPGYVFMQGDPETRQVALRTNRVANVIPVADQELFIRELAHIQCALKSGEAVALFPALQPGQRCRVIGGPLVGVEGTVVRQGARCRIFIAVTILGQSASLQIDGSLLQPVAA